MSNENSEQKEQRGGSAGQPKQRMNMDELKQMAEDRTDAPVTVLPDPGKPIPKRFDNPPPGEAGHKCIDLQGLYDPSWHCLLLHGYEGAPKRQVFKCAGRPYRVRYGQWVDVPPEIIEVLSMAEVATIKSAEVDEESLVAGPARPVIVGKTPRLNYSTRASA